jgi:hypothetical protein
MKRLKINKNEVGINITIPYQTNDNYAKSIHGLGIRYAFAADVLGAWSKHLQLILVDRARKMEETLVSNINNLCCVQENVCVTNQGKKFYPSAYTTICDAVEALEEGKWKEFLRHYAQTAICTLAMYTNPEVQNEISLECLMEVLVAADHDCID